MVQRIFISLMHVITNTFFRRIDVVGDENIPTEGPVIFAGNHPNALMDGWLLTARCGRWPLHFMVNAKLWEYRILGRMLDAMGAVPVYRREEHEGDVDNSKAFDKLYEVIESGNCMGIFPEGVSHTESQLTKLKTGTARIALSVAARGNVKVTIIPCGLNYIHRDRFRSQVLIEFGEPIVIDGEWLAKFEADERAAVLDLTEHLAQALIAVTLNAPDWSTLRFIQAARRLYKPATANLSPGVYIELNRRFVETYLRVADEPGMSAFRHEVDEYQSRLDVLGLKDYQLRKKVSIGKAFRRLMMRSLMIMLLLPVAIPAVILHLPVGWIAAVVGDKFSYETDDIATLKVFATVTILPLLYIVAAFFIGNYFGIGWAIVAVVGLTISFSASVWVIEAQATLLVSMVSILRRTRLRAEIEDLQATRARLVDTVRSLADRYADPDTPRIFSNQDFATTGVIQSDE
ncbi:MAG: 1-acyl-sn-glycerol-3-phosphate acyltransferase [Proteobacteria bacterium]|nr:1-acyl-sn-glycerol-3-phosphate acyltransferase [Pseudomonadota bacterium]